MKKVDIIKIIHDNTNFTYKEIENKYEIELNKYPDQAYYYAKKRTITKFFMWANRVSWGSLVFKK